MDLRTGIPALAVFLGCLGLVTSRVLAAPAPVPPRTADLGERIDLAIDIHNSERAWKEETAQNFPSDLWSQRDDFHGREFRRVVDLAKEKGVRIEDVLRAIDEDIHRRRATTSEAPDDRNARAIPCKPRPFYD